MTSRKLFANRVSSGILIKNPGNAEAHEKYLDVQKAHETLTNELNRVNYEKYGNPDGPVQMEFGIALPSWLLDARNSPAVLFAYIGGFIVLFPVILYLFIKKWRNVAENEVHLDTMRFFFPHAKRPIRL